MTNVRAIRQMVEQGLTDDEIQEALDEAQMARDDLEQRFGSDYEDERSPYQKEMCDRLDMGRNDAGEWLGFM